MQEQITQLQDQVTRLQGIITEIQEGKNLVFSDSMSDVLVERVLNTDTTGTPSTNTILRTITIGPGGGSVEVLDYPERIMIFRWKGRRLAIPVYDADKIIYP